MKLCLRLLLTTPTARTEAKRPVKHHTIRVSSLPTRSFGTQMEAESSAHAESRPTPSESGSDGHDERPNRWDGPSSTWRDMNREEIATFTALEEVGNRDLAVHLYNAFALKQHGGPEANSSAVPIPGQVCARACLADWPTGGAHRKHCRMSTQRRVCRCLPATGYRTGAGLPGPWPETRCRQMAL